MNKTYQVFGPFFEIIKNDTIYIIRIVVSQYGYVLYYIILYIGTYNTRKIVSIKVLKNRNFHQKRFASYGRAILKHQDAGTNIPYIGFFYN